MFLSIKLIKCNMVYPYNKLPANLKKLTSSYLYITWNKSQTILLHEKAKCRTQYVVHLCVCFYHLHICKEYIFCMQRISLEDRYVSSWL